VTAGYSRADASAVCIGGFNPASARHVFMQDVKHENQLNEPDLASAFPLVQISPFNEGVPHSLNFGSERRQIRYAGHWRFLGNLAAQRFFGACRKFVKQFEQIVYPT
jgi:hypothetical protein